ncbi:MAG: hypothetical protein KY450_11190 [Actinobacteria bacterium]|nr:hypothetical protein [Actinomycetota bacterium]
MQVSGWLDPVVVDFLEDALAEAEREEVTALVVQVDSPGSLVERPVLDRLLKDQPQLALYQGYGMTESAALVSRASDGAVASA